MKKLITFTLSAFIVVTSFAASSHAKAIVKTEKQADGGESCYVVTIDPVTGNEVHVFVHKGPCVLPEMKAPVRKDATAEIRHLGAIQTLYPSGPQACWTSGEWNDCVATLGAESCSELEEAGFEWVIYDIVVTPENPKPPYAESKAQIANAKELVELHPGNGKTSPKCKKARE